VTEPASVARAPLYVESDLTLTYGDVEVPVRSTGDRLFLEFPSITSAVGATRDLPNAPAQPSSFGGLRSASNPPYKVTRATR